MNISQKTEIWKPVFNYEHLYEVSNFGRVRSCKKFNKGLVLSPCKWKGYYSVILYKNGKPATTKVHRIVISSFVGFSRLDVDHINCERGDNRLENLRYCNRTQNNMNQKSTLGSSSRYKGVSWSSERNKWVSGIMINRKQKYLGRFESEKEAALKYDKIARAMFGKFARTNFPEADLNPRR